MKPMRRGDTGPAVREIQGNLRRAGAKIGVDGIFGPDTDQAVRAFQTARHLRVDGLVGPRTLNALLRRPAVPRKSGSDPFDPSAFARWLANLPGAVYDAVLPDEEPTRSVPPPSAPRPSPRPAPQSAAPKPAAPSRPAPAVRPTGRPVVTPSQNRKHRRISFPGYEGKGYVLQDFQQYDGFAIRLLKGVSVAPFNPNRKIRNECAQFVQFFGVPHTSTWRKGPQVCHLEPGSLPVGTVIATLRDGKYYSDHSGRSHVGVYMSHDPHDKAGGQMWMMDQYNGAPIKRRGRRYDVDANANGRATDAWKDSAGRTHTNRVNWGSDAEEYFVLLTR